MKKLYIRADASPKMGTGHVMRCISLAKMAQEFGFRAEFFCRVHSAWLRQYLEAESFILHELEGEIPTRENPENLLKSLGSPKEAWLVFDGYHFQFDCQKVAKSAGYKILYIDDYAHLAEYTADILLNQNIGAQNLNYSGEVGKKLLGLDYTMLRPEFLVARQSFKYANKAENILLSLGGGDMSKVMAELAPAVKTVLQAAQFKNCQLHIIAGSASTGLIEDIFSGLNYQIYSFVKNMAHLLRSMDICISAGGSTCWELCCLGLPFLSVEVAENQHNIVQALERYDIAKVFGANNFYELLMRPDLRQRARQNGLNLVDGLGTKRIIEAMLAYE